MKKILIVCLAFVMLMSMSLSVLAEVGGFIESPSNNQAPVLIKGENETDGCLAQLIITAYADRANLPEDIRVLLEKAYKDIKSNPNLSALNGELNKIAEDLGVRAADLAVSDLFDIRAIGCDVHAEHGRFVVTLKADTLKNFACLLHYDNGEWHIVEGAKVTNNGTQLEFTEDEFSPFAIVVNTVQYEPETPPTGDYSAIFAAVSVISGLLLIVLVIRYKKTNA